jgi:hypothetical protein
MTTYKEIFGKYVKNYSSDPSSDAEGQIWYNSTSGTFKSQVLVAAAWASGGNLNTARYYMAGCGTQTAGLAFLGDTGPAASVATEKYNGSTWTSVNNANTARTALAGAGTQTAAVAFGGFFYPEYAPGGPGEKNNTENYNGTSWTASGTLTTARSVLAGAGTQTAALAFGGTVHRATPAIQSATEEYDGSTWTVGGSLNTARQNLAGAGTQTAALGFGGYSGGPGDTGATETYNGTSWTTSPATLNTVRVNLAGAGTQTAALAFGGYPPSSGSTATETWNGISWTVSTAMATGRYGGAGAGTQTVGLSFGGGYPITATTEEYTGAALTVKTITTS